MAGSITASLWPFHSVHLESSRCGMTGSVACKVPSPTYPEDEAVLSVAHNKGRRRKITDSLVRYIFSLTMGHSVRIK